MYTGIAEFAKEITVYAVHNVQGITGFAKDRVYTVQCTGITGFARYFTVCWKTGITGFAQKVSALCWKQA